MKTILLVCALVMLVGCSVTYTRTSSQPVRWKQALLDGGVSPQCLSLIRTNNCQEFAESSRRFYQTLGENRDDNVWGTDERLIMEGMMRDIENELRILVNYPECRIAP